MTFRQTQTLKQRFFSKVALPTAPDGCWMWIGGTHASNDGHRYGCFWRREGSDRAHVVSYEIYNGPVPTGKEIDHICGVKLCVAPGHLRAVTHAENLQNRRTATTKSGVRGVYQWKSGRWNAQIRHLGKLHYLGTFDTAEEAAAARRRAEIRLFKYSPLSS